MAVEPVITKEESPKKSMLGSIGFGGKEGKPKKEKKVKEKKVKNNAGGGGDDDNDDSSVCSTTSNGDKNWLGLEKKKPRAEYQAEIDELRLKLVAVEDELATKTTQLDRFLNWARQMPR
ncbi:hypothetical protein FRACYDRAFT_269548 [Fragilariopsis cylindrus CCMP1102]|uniref:Uncharacterized protein n=1 Tax=Fragilariopsis cylindrus CCMP1102 TaxID=635003 RepID=A0A1E7F7S4_9STRA|nr:hypothetical protein FRACYDRAFT_269548 [Fragilariopsis cylindrus CCMP1102]|eukprot:OEU14206.1 hypothetical protein FRACYDRAFT_269548 [Fragilariopsis cylindrus CCMP1102]